MQHQMLRRLILIMVFTIVLVWGIAMLIPGVLLEYSGLLAVGASYTALAVLVNVIVGVRFIQYAQKNKSLRGTFYLLGISAITNFVFISMPLSVLTYMLIRPRDLRKKEYGWRRIPYFRKYIPASLYEEKRAAKASAKAAARAQFSERVSAEKPAPSSIAASSDKKYKDKLDID